MNADLLVVVLSIERALLLALLTSNWGSVLFLRIGTPLAFVVDETGYDVAVLARTGFAVQFDVLLTLFTNCGRAAFPEIKKFQSPQYFLIAKYISGELHQSKSISTGLGGRLLKKEGRSSSLTCSAGTLTGKKYISLLGRNLDTPATQ